MAVRSQTFDGPVGSNILTVPWLAYRNIVSVKKEGLGYDIITTGTVANRQVLYTESAGSFKFINNFTTSYEGVNGSGSYISFTPEKIFIIWDE